MTSVPFDPVAVRTLATILTDTGITEIEIVEGSSRIRLARSPAPLWVPVQPVAAPPAATPPIKR